MAEPTKQNSQAQVRIMVVDDHDIVRRGLISLISRREDFQVVGEASNASEAVARARELSPDVIVMDIRMLDGSGIEACRDIRAANPKIKVLFLTSYSDEEAVVSAIMAGASGYLLKEIRSQEILNAIASVGSGRSLLDPSVTGKVLERMRHGSADEKRWSSLSDTEKQILELVAQGKTNKEIAEEVHLSDKTVKNYASNILTKLEVARRSQAAAFMVEREAKKHFST